MERLVALPFGKSVEIAYQSIRVRFFRSLITTLSLVLAVAFLCYVQAGNRIAEAVLQSGTESGFRALLLAGYDIKPGETSIGESAKQRWIVILSLLVCVVGIVNAQLMAVTERFREIGTMKCLGALDSFILRLFLLEAFMQGLIGSSAGALVGAVFAVASSAFLFGTLVFAVLPAGGITLTILTATAIGCLLSLIGVVYPAWKAARMATGRGNARGRVSHTPAPGTSMSEQHAIIRTTNVVKTFQLGSHTLEVLKGISLTIAAGRYISIMGPSGSGKSTLFNMIGGLDKPTSGKVFIDEVDIAQLDAYELAWLRCRKIGYIFQTFNLIPVMTALENVTLPMIFAGTGNDEAVERGMILLKTVGLADRYNHKPSELSGGQQQRVAVARALANSPAIILADEPTGNLDLTTGEEIINLLKQMSDERKVTIISATHDFKMLNVSDEVIWIRDGLIDKIEQRDELRISVGTIE
jgi:putative ABC transport system ATP-binding protein